MTSSLHDNNVHQLNALPRKMYHVSTTDHGKKVTFEPRLCNADSVETQRTCVAPTLAGCFSAIRWFDVWSDEKPHVYLYEAVEPEKAIPCSEKVPDRHITDEHWFTESAKFRLIGVVYGNSQLYQQLQLAAMESWCEFMDRCPTQDLGAQQKEFDLAVDIFESVSWGQDNMPSKDTTSLFDNYQLNLQALG